MEKKNRFEDLHCWQKSRQLTVDIYSLTNANTNSNDFGFQNQIRRAAISIMNNIAEGYGRYKPKDFARFLDISIGSCAEVKSMLFIGQDLNYIDPEVASKLQESCRIIRAQLLSLKKYLKKTDRT